MNNLQYHIPLLNLTVTSANYLYKHQLIFSYLRNIYTNLKSYNFNIKKFSRYSASTIMPHNTFNLNNYDIIGFDLDCTLLRYNLNTMIPLEYNIIAKYLVEKKNYSKDLLKPIDKDIDFLQKGLLLDTERGNIIKLDCKGVIGKAAHGTTLLSENEIINIYGPEKKWDISTQYIKDPLSTWNGPDAVKLRALLDYFDMPSSLILARAVDLLDKSNNGKQLPKYEIWPDILEALTQMYKKENFNHGSEYFENLRKNPSVYIKKSERFVIERLKELRKTKAIFLLTGSNIDFANLTASYALGHNWRDLFDIVIAYAKKPGFFTMTRPFYNFEGGHENQIVLDNSIQMGNTYAQGNWKAIEIKLSKKFGKTIKNPRTLYLGDNLLQDIYTPSKFCNLDTVSLVEELEEHDCEDDYAYKRIIHSKFWGSYFFVDSKPSFWNEIISLYSKISFPTIEHLCKNPMNNEYECTNPLKHLYS